MVHQSQGLKTISSMEFSTGLNILWGRNGTGKSSVLKLLARMFHAESGGRSVITSESCKMLVDFYTEKADKWREGLELVHDGQPVFYANPSEAVGITGGQFDDDFFEEGFRNTKFKGSSGETTIFRLDSVTKHAVRQTEVEDRLENSGGVWKELHDKALDLLKPNCPKGPVTILMDEPDRSLDFDLQDVLWKQIRRISKGRQMIVATHSVFAMNVAGAKYHELSPGYLDDCRSRIAKVSHG